MKTEYLGDFNYNDVAYIEQHADNICNWTSHRFTRVVSDEFLDKFIEKINLWRLDEAQVISDQIIENHPSILKERWIFMENKLTDYFIDKYVRTVKDWRDISCNHHLTEAQIEKYADKLDWEALVTRKIPLSFSFLNKYKDKIDWHIYVENHRNYISDDFCREFMDYVDWSFISYNCDKLSYEFMREFRSYIQWYCVSCSIDNIFCRKKYLDFVREFKKELWWDLMSGKYFVEDEWKTIRDEFEDLHE